MRETRPVWKAAAAGRFAAGDGPTNLAPGVVDGGPGNGGGGRGLARSAVNGGEHSGGHRGELIVRRAWAGAGVVGGTQTVMRMHRGGRTGLPCGDCVRRDTPTGLLDDPIGGIPNACVEAARKVVLSPLRCSPRGRCARWARRDGEGIAALVRGRATRHVGCSGLRMPPFATMHQGPALVSPDRG